MKIKQIPIFCQACKGVDILNLGQYAKFVGRKWDLIWQNNLSPEQKQIALNSKRIGHGELVVNIKNLGRKMKENGMIDHYCRKCLAIATDQYYSSQGFSSVRYGNVVTDINYYEQHQKEISLLVAEMKN